MYQFQRIDYQNLNNKWWRRLVHNSIPNELIMINREVEIVRHNKDNILNKI